MNPAHLGVHAAQRLQAALPDNPAPQIHLCRKGPRWCQRGWSEVVLSIATCGCYQNIAARTDRVGRKETTYIPQEQYCVPSIRVRFGCSTYYLQALKLCQMCVWMPLDIRRVQERHLASEYKKLQRASKRVRQVARKKALSPLAPSEVHAKYSFDKGRLRSRPEFGLGVLGLGFGAVPAAQGR